jgi:hypothetical protein
MELSLKLPAGKFPFIGIRFTDLKEAAELNADLFDLKPAGSFHIVLQPELTHCDLKIFCNEPAVFRTYKNLNHDPFEFRDWSKKLNPTMNFNFGHIVKIDGKDRPIINTLTDKLYVIKVESISIDGQELK